MVAQQSRGEIRQIPRGRALGGIGQAVGVGEMGAGQAELLRLVVHPAHEGRLVARKMLGQRGRGVVGGGDRDAFQQHVERYLLAGAQAHAIPGRGRGVRADRDGLVDIGAAGFERFARQIERHQLDQTCRCPLCLGVLGEHGAAFRIEQDHGLGAQRRWARRRLSDGGSRERQEHDSEREQQARRVHCVHSSERPERAASKRLSEWRA